MTTPEEPARYWRRTCLLLLGLVLCRGVAALCVMPPFEGWDEYEHLGYVEYVRETRRRPVLGEAVVPPALAQAALTFPHPPDVARGVLGPYRALDYAAFWSRRDPPDLASAVGGGGALYQAQHGPLFYRLVAPAFAWFGGVNDLRASVAGLRLVNLGLTVAAVGVFLAVSRRVFMRTRDAALAALPLAAHPLFLLNGTRVANDAAGLLLATIAVGLGFGLALGRRPTAWAWPLGVAAGLAAAVKATNLALLPFLAVCWVAGARGASVRARVGSALLLAAGWLLPMAGDLQFNLAHYGVPTAMQEAVANRRAGRSTADLVRAARSIPWESTLRRLWVRELYFKGGWSFLRTHPALTQGYQAAVTVGLVGWGVLGLRRLTGRRDPVFVAPAIGGLMGMVVVGYTVALAYHMVQSKVAWGEPTTCAWYACAGLPWFLALVVVGGFAWVPSRLRAAVPLAVAAVCLAGEFVGAYGQMVPTYSGGATGAEALRRLAALQPPALGTATLFAALAGEVLIAAAVVLTLRDWARFECTNAPASLDGRAGASSVAFRPKGVLSGGSRAAGPSWRRAGSARRS